MEFVFGNRYEIRRSVRELPLGTLYEAYDRSLNRVVLVYEIAPEKTPTDSREAVKRGAAFTHDRFMHILDVGSEKGMPFAVFKICDGGPLIDELHRYRMRPQQLLAAVYELGQAMQDAAEEGVYGYSVSADNIWLGTDGKLMPIHYWDAADERRRGAAGLCNLLYQLAARTDDLPDHPDAAEDRLRMTLRSLSFETVDAVLALYRRVHREKLSLTAFLLELHAFTQAFAAPKKPPAQPVPSSEPRITREPSRPQAAPLRAKPEPKAEQPAPAFKQPAPIAEARRPVMKPVAERFEDESDEAEADEAAAVTSRKTVWKRVGLLAGVACLFTVVFIGGLMLIFRLANPPEPSHAEAKAGASQPAETAAPAQPAAKSQTPKETPASDDSANQDSQPAAADPTSIPQLVGLTKSEAEKRALASGLHYTFYIENDSSAKDTVFRQEPKPGDPAVKGDSISFWVSKGN